MTPEELAETLKAELLKRGWVIDDLAESAGVAFETARRATQAIGSISLESTNKLLAAVGRKLATVEKVPA